MLPRTSQNNSISFSNISLLHRLKTIFMRWVNRNINYLWWSTTIWLVFKETQHLSLWKRSSRKSLCSLPEGFFPWEDKEGIGLLHTEDKGKERNSPCQERLPLPMPFPWLNSSPTFSCPYPCSSYLTATLLHFLSLSSSCSQPAHHVGEGIGHLLRSLWLFQAKLNPEPMKVKTKGTNTG